jgi:hypothetical protein
MPINHNEARILKILRTLQVAPVVKEEGALTLTKKWAVKKEKGKPAGASGSGLHDTTIRHTTRHRNYA